MNKSELDQVAAELAKSFNDTADAADQTLRRLPNAGRVIEALALCIESIFPGRSVGSSGGSIPEADLASYVKGLLLRARPILQSEIAKALPFRWVGAAARIVGCPDGALSESEALEEAGRIADHFLASLPKIRSVLVGDVEAAYEGDPSALTYAEVQIAFPGVLAITSHRLAHHLYLAQVPIVPRIMSEWTHTQTGIDIHPGATIGRGFFIDHGTGVVIGETAEIGNRVKLYQGVTLGAKSFSLDENGNPIKHGKRHPTVEDGVIIYANAIILGGETTIGSGTIIGGGVFLMESVPPGSMVVAKRAELQILQQSKGGAKRGASSGTSGE